MAFEIEFTPKAAKQFSKLDNPIKKRIQEALIRIQAQPDPRSSGKALQGDLSGLWRYRVGDYRLLARIIDDKLVILLVTIEHRSSVYN